MAPKDKDSAKAALELRAVGDDYFDEARHEELKEEVASISLNCERLARNR